MYDATVKTQSYRAGYIYVVTSGLLFPGKDRRKIKWHKNFLPAGPYWIFRPLSRAVLDFPPGEKNRILAFYLFVYIFIYIYIYIYLFIYLIIDWFLLFLFLSFFIFLYLFLSFFLYLSLSLSFFLSFSISFFLSFCLSIFFFWRILEIKNIYIYIYIVK